MAGYNYAQMDEDTFDDRIEKIRAGNMSALGKKTRIDAIEAAKKAWLESKRKTDIIAQKQRLDRADDDQKATIKEFKTRDVLQDDPSSHTFKTTPKAPPKKKYTSPARPHGNGGGSGVSTAGQATGVSRSAPQRDYSRHHAYGLNRGGIVDLL